MINYSYRLKKLLIYDVNPVIKLNDKPKNKEKLK